MASQSDRSGGLHHFRAVLAAGVLAGFLFGPIPAIAQRDGGFSSESRNYNITKKKTLRQRKGGKAPWKTFVATQFVLKPMLSPTTQTDIGRAIRLYQSIVDYGGWPVIPAKAKLKQGKRDRHVALLRRRLELTGDLAPNKGDPNAYDGHVRQAVRLFQYRHGLQTDGVIGPSTLQALNVPARQRLRALQQTLARMKDYPHGLGNRYLVVNIPGAELETVQNGRVYSRHVVVVGKKSRPSPDLKSRVSEINFFPYWHPPESIIRRDIIPAAIKDPRYFFRSNLKVYDPQAGGAEVNPMTVDWRNVTSTRYRMRQEPGPQNAMASVKINFSNAHAVYMHDTPNKSLFDNKHRYDSSGCVRVDAPHLLTEWLLRGERDWSAARIREVVDAGQRLDTRVQQSIPIRWVYMTGWANADGLVFFRDDVYRLDG